MRAVTTLRIANFKAFGAAQRIPLRPITLIYGANSAGKSSILHALALAHHAIETGDLDTQTTRIGGESIDLGGFRQYVHRHKWGLQVELVFELDPEHLPGRMTEILHSVRKVVVELSIGSGFTGEQPTLFGDVMRKLDREGRVRVERYSIQIDGSSLLSMSVRRDGLFRLDHLDYDHPMFKETLNRILTFVTTSQKIHYDDFDGLNKILDSLIAGMTARQRGLFPWIEDVLKRPRDDAGNPRRQWRGFRRISITDELEESPEDANDSVIPISRGQRQQDFVQAIRIFLPGILHDFVGGISSILEAEVRKLIYLGPLRSYPPRHLASSQHHDPNWSAGGGYAWDVVRTRADVRKRVNDWLGDAKRLKTPYALEIRDLLSAALLPEELLPKLEGAMHDSVRRLHYAVSDEKGSGLLREAIEAVQFSDTSKLEDKVEELFNALIDTEELTRQWVDEIVASRAEPLQDLILIDKRSGTAVSHRDVGIGVSQVLPVLVSAYASSGKLLAIEQPEIHLHPALQAELGDVFLESALGGGDNTLVIESHSEHLLLRIMRRIRETSTGDLPDGIPEVRPQDVMVLFVEPDGEQSLIREMPLNERGELVKAWPGGFFEESLREIF